MSAPVALHGNLSDFGISEVFQLIGQQRKTGILAVRGRGLEVELRFDEGCIVSAAPVGTHEQAALGEMLVRCGLLTRERLAELERERESSLLPLDGLLVDRGVLAEPQIREVEELLTRDTLFDLLRWSEGSFRFVPRPIRHDRDPQQLLGAEQVLMDGLRMVDEWRSMAEEVPPDSAVLRRTGSFEDYRRSRSGGDSAALAEEERVFLLVDGRLPVRRVVDLSRLGTFECSRILVALRRARLIEPTQAPRVKAPGPRPADPGRGRRVAASVLALAALVAVVALIPSAPTGRSVLAIERDPYRAARLRFETQRMRNVADAIRFASGRPPRGLAELRRRDPALAAAGSGYYYAERGNGAIILAPEH